jgi:hypothetical protein
MAPELPDEHLLKKFIGARDEIAFATLVRRHGPMVLGIARRVLGNLDDAEDVLAGRGSAEVIGRRDPSKENRQWTAPLESKESCCPRYSVSGQVFSCGTRA